MHIFYSPNINDLFLDREESHHCNRVLRLKTGDKIIVVDGKGTYAESIITAASDKKTEFSVDCLKEQYNSMNYKLTVVIAPTKNINRFEWFVEKATEIGVSHIVPVICNNSERKTINHDRIKKLVISSAKQSLKAYFPEVSPMVNFNDVIKNDKFKSGPGFIAHCYEGDKTKFTDLKGELKNIIVCIGPEGDFSKKEIEVAHENGFRDLDLGKSRLRTETAGVFACSALNLLNNKPLV